MSSTIHVGTTIRRKLPNGDQIEHTINWSGVPVVSGVGLDELLRFRTSELIEAQAAEATLAIDATLERIGTKPKPKFTPPETLPKGDGSGPSTAPAPEVLSDGATSLQAEAASTEDAKTSPDEEKPEQEEAKASPEEAKTEQEEAKTETAPFIPRDEDVEVGVNIFGVDVPFPSGGPREVITDTNADGSGGGQLKAVNTALGSLGYKGDTRHLAMNAWLNEYWSEDSPSEQINSIRDISREEAHAFLDWASRATDESKALLKSAVTRAVEQAQPNMLAQLTESVDVAQAARELLALNKHEPEAQPEPEDEDWAILRKAGIERLEDAEDPFADHVGMEVWEAAQRILVKEGKIKPKVVPNKVPAVVAPAKLELSASQAQTLESIIRSAPGTFHFVTGPAGTGKSTVGREVVEYYRGQILVTAPSGLAALNVGGETIHSTFKIRTGPVDWKQIKAPRYPQENLLRAAKIIMIDEISMCRADLLDGVSATLQKVMRNDHAFGGKKVVAFGDMLQLPPVVKSTEAEFVDRKYASEFWFDAHCLGGDQKGGLFNTDFQTAELVRHNLTDIFRQRDPAFIDALNLIRVGDPSGLFALNARAGEAPDPSAIVLTFKNDDANAINMARLTNLQGVPKTYLGAISGEMAEDND
ncbi:MAG: AAA family ATPase, partial [Chthoniobacterales bacterium]